jgi:methionyl-tRNA formyltransferase
MMRIVFIGAVDFSCFCLKEVLENGGNVVTVFTLAKEHAGFHSDYADLTDLVTKHRIDIHQIKNINDSENITRIHLLQPDIIFVFGWSQILSQPLLDIPPLGCIGTHPALLPRNRGRHPLAWALVEALEESGLTFFYLDAEADNGDILWQKAFPITLEDDASSLYEKTKQLASESIRDLLPLVEQGRAPRIPQDHRQATYWRKRSKKDGEIDWETPTMRTYNLIRALAPPYVGAHTYATDEKVLIWRARLPQKPLLSEASHIQPGTVLARTDTGFDVKTSDGFLTVLEYEYVGERAIEVGTQLGGHP